MQLNRKFNLRAQEDARDQYTMAFISRNQSLFDIPAATYIGQSIDTANIPHITCTTINGGAVSAIVSLGSNPTLTGVWTFANTTPSTGIGTGALIIAGGISCANTISAQSVAAQSVAAQTTTVGATDMTNVAFGASYAASFTAQVGATPSGTPVGAPAITGAMLDLRSSVAPKYVSYAAPNLTAIADIITVRCIFVPNYSGAPATNQCFFSMGDPAPPNFNQLSIWHSTTNRITWRAVSSGGAITTTSFLIATPFVAGQAYEIELNRDANIIGSMNIFINGVRPGLAGAPSVGFSGANSVIYVGATATNPADATFLPDFRVHDLIVYNTIQHTANYTPTYYVLTPLVSPGIISAAGASIIGAISATNIRCSSMPAADNDVIIRKHLAPIAFVLADGGAQLSVNMTVELYRYGNIVFASFIGGLGALIGVGPNVTSIQALAVIPANMMPPVNCSSQCYAGTATTDSQSRTIITLLGDILVSASGAGWPAGAVFSYDNTTISWRCTAPW